MLLARDVSTLSLCSCFKRYSENETESALMRQDAGANTEESVSQWKDSSEKTDRKQNALSDKSNHLTKGKRQHKPAERIASNDNKYTFVLWLL